MSRVNGELRARSFRSEELFSSLIAFKEMLTQTVGEKGSLSTGNERRQTLPPASLLSIPHLPPRA
jgi:hypothetical protein